MKNMHYLLLINHQQIAAIYYNQVIFFIIDNLDISGEKLNNSIAKKRHNRSNSVIEYDNKINSIKTRYDIQFMSKTRE